MRELGSVSFDGIPQLRRSAIVTDKDSISVHWVVENAGSLDCVHDDCYILVAGRDEYVHVWNIVANQMLFFANSGLDGYDSEYVR
jgi:hypothetical protein